MAPILILKEEANRKRMRLKAEGFYTYSGVMLSNLCGLIQGSPDNSEWQIYPCLSSIA